MKSNKYKIIITLILTIILFETGFAFAQDSQQPWNPFIWGIKRPNQQGYQRGFLPDITQCGKIDAQGKRIYDFGTCLLWFFNKVLSIIYTLALFLGVIFLVYAGIEYITKPGSAQQVHQRLIWGIVGIVVAIVAFSLVKAIEISLSTEGGGGTITETPVVEPPEYEQEPAAGEADKAQKITIPRVLVDNISFIPEGQSYTIIFTERLDTSDFSKFCNVDLRIFNLSNGRTKQYQFKSDNTSTLHGRKDAGGMPIDLPYASKSGDKIQLQFIKNIECQVPSSVSLIVPTVSATPVAPGIPQRPQISIAAPRILGQQKFTVELPENLKDVILEVFDIYFRQSKLFDPPFYLYLTYATLENPASNSSCTLVVSVSGVRVASYSSNKQAISVKSFNTPFSIPLSLEKNRRNYSKMIPIGLSNNIVEQIRLKAVELRSCDYQGPGNITDWRYSVRITTQ